MRYIHSLAALLLIPIVASLAACGDPPPEPEAPAEEVAETAAGESQTPPVVRTIHRRM